MEIPPARQAGRVPRNDSDQRQLDLELPQPALRLVPPLPPPARAPRGAARRRGRARAADLPAYQVKVTLLGTRPPVWRRLVLPGQWHLGLVHAALQVAMGWTDSHLHEFEVGGRRIGVPDDEGWGRPTERETTVRLGEVVRGVGDRVDYEYDFGDGWRHRVVVEAELPHAGEARCLAGRRACPPEDCGGPWGYEELLVALADPGHEQHEELRQWVGDCFAAGDFDLALTDGLLRSIS